MVIDQAKAVLMQSARKVEKMIAVLVAEKKRLHLALNRARSMAMSQDEVLLVRADKTTRRRLTFLQRLPTRIIILIAIGAFFYFFVTESKVGLMSVMFLMPPVIIPIGVFAGVLVTTKLDPFDVRLRREYMRLCEQAIPNRTSHVVEAPKRDIAQRMIQYRASFYQEIRKNRRQTTRSHSRVR